MKDNFRKTDLDRVPGTRCNYTFKTGEDTVIKYFASFPLLEPFMTLAHLAQGDLSIPTARERARAEEEFRDNFSDINTPDILRREGRILEEELIEGKTLFEAVEKDEVSAKKLGQDIGSIVSKIESQDILVWDITLADFIHSEGEIWLTDVEWFHHGNSSIHRKIIKSNVYTDSKSMSREDQKRILEGMEGELGSLTLVEKFYGELSYYLL